MNEIRKEIISAHHTACFERDVYVLNKYRQLDEIDHFSAHAIIQRVEHLWNDIMTEEERQYVEDAKQANFETTMLMLEMDCG
jgi:hypothetical protein